MSIVIAEWQRLLIVIRVGKTPTEVEISSVQIEHAHTLNLLRIEQVLLCKNSRRFS